MTLMVSRQRQWNMLDFFFGEIQEEFIGDHLKIDGDYLIRKSKHDEWVVSVKWEGSVKHYHPKIRYDLLNFGMHEFRQINDLIYYHWHMEIPLFRGSNVQPVLATPIRCPRKKYKMADIEMVGKIGEGNFGEVYKVKLANGTFAAMKTLKATVSKEVRDNFVDEMHMIAPMKHDNVVQCLGTVEDDENVKIILEFINKGSLLALLRTGRLTDRGKARVLIHVAKGLQYLHRHSIIHRDLAARNILIHRNDNDTITAKVSDFGLSYKDEGEGYHLTTAQCLPLKWLAPECFIKQRWTTASDVWSFGILIWEVFNNGKEPYSDMMFADFHALTKYIKQGGHPINNNMVTSEIRKIMVSCWTSSPENRPNMDDVVYDLEKLFPNIH